MSKPVTVTIPHHSTRDAVLARIRGHVAQIKAKAAPFVTAIEEHWEGEELAFAVTAVGQRITGRIAVDEEAVRLTVELPWMLAAVAAPLRRRVAREAIKLLPKP
jgi:hypothetical protein